MTYDVTRIRAAFPSLAGPDAAAHFDGPGGSQTPLVVGEAILRTLTGPLANRGPHTVAQRNAEDAVVACRQAVADLVGGDPRGVVFGRSMTQLTMDMARALSAHWRPGDEVVVTRLDHDANVRPWVIAAERVGATARFVDFDPATGELTPDHVAAVLSERTRVVALTAAANLIGTMPDIAAISRLVHDAGALLHVDGVHFAAHELPDLAAMGADFLSVSPYKFCGPHCGTLTAAPELLATIAPDKLLPSNDAVPERFELGTLPYELMAGTTAAIDFLAGLVPGEGSRRERLAASYAALHEHETRLRTRIEEGLAELGATVFSRAARRTPTLAFTLPGLDDAHVYAELARRGVNAPAGNFYALECSRTLGLGDRGAIRAGLAPYNDDADVDRLLTALREIARR